MLFYKFLLSQMNDSKQVVIKTQLGIETFATQQCFHCPLVKRCHWRAAPHPVYIYYSIECSWLKLHSKRTVQRTTDALIHLDLDKALLQSIIGLCYV